MTVPTIAVKESLDDLKGIGPSTGISGFKLVYVIGKGLYQWQTGDQSSNVPSGNDADNWVAPSEDTSGKSGAWQLDDSGILDPEHATDSGTDAFVSATNTSVPGDGVTVTRDFQSASTTTTPTLDGKTMTTRDGSALWAGAVSGVHDVQYASGTDTYLVLDPLSSVTARQSSHVKRDIAGRAKFTDPSAAQDAATKGYVDTQDATFEQQRAQAWVSFDGTGTVAINDHYNVSSITDNGTGDYTVNFSTNLADTNYCPVLGGENGVGSITSVESTVAVGSFEINTYDATDSLVDRNFVTAAVFGGN